MWDKLFTASLVTFVIGIALFLVVPQIVEQPPQILLLAAAAFVALGGLVVGVSGFALLLTTGRPNS